MPKLVVSKCDNSYLFDFLCGRWSFGVVLYEIFTMGKYNIVRDQATFKLNNNFRMFTD